MAELTNHQKYFDQIFRMFDDIRLELVLFWLKLFLGLIQFSNKKAYLIHSLNVAFCQKTLILCMQGIRSQNENKPKCPFPASYPTANSSLSICHRCQLGSLRTLNNSSDAASNLSLLLFKSSRISACKYFRLAL